MKVETIRIIDIIPKRHAFKARFYNSAELKNWVDFGSVQKDFSYSFFWQRTSFGEQGVFNLLYTKYPAIAITIINNTIFFINYSPNLILQAVFTQPENDSPSFLACWLICSSKSSSKRRFFLVLFERSYLFFSFFSCTGTPLCVKLLLKGTPHYKCGNLKKQSPEVLPALPRDLTTITLTEVMIMANRYDSAHLCARQSKPSKSSKKHLHKLNHSGYIDNALAKSKDRIGTLNSYLATHDAQRVFFCVNACAHLFINISSMVALVGQPKGWLGHQVTSSSNPANVIANEIGTSSGDYVNNYLEAVIMTTIPTPVISNQKLFKFYDLSTAQVIETTAKTERQARKSLGNPSLIFIARTRLYPVIEQVQKIEGYHYE
jgi:hypothetical protein